MKNFIGQLNKPLWVAVISVLVAAVISAAIGLICWMTEIHMHGVRQEALTTHQTVTLSDGLKEMNGKMDNILNKLADHDKRIAVNATDIRNLRDKAKK